MCENDFSITRKFKFGYAWSVTYRIGEKFVVDQKGNVPVDKFDIGKCPHCTGDSDFDIIIKDKKLYRTPRRIRINAALQRKNKQTVKA